MSISQDIYIYIHLHYVFFSAVISLLYVYSHFCLVDLKLSPAVLLSVSDDAGTGHLISVGSTQRFGVFIFIKLQEGF